MDDTEGIALLFDNIIDSNATGQGGETYARLLKEKARRCAERF